MYLSYYGISPRDYRTYNFQVCSFSCFCVDGSSSCRDTESFAVSFMCLQNCLTRTVTSLLHLRKSSLLPGLGWRVSFSVSPSLASWSKTSSTPSPSPDSSNLPFLLYCFSLQLTPTLYPTSLSLFYVSITRTEVLEETIFVLFSLSSAWHLIGPQILVEQLNEPPNTVQDQEKNGR